MPKRPRRTRLSTSPLVDPAVTSMVLILPNPDDPAGLDAFADSTYRHNLSAIASAAAIADIPTFALSRAPGKPQRDLLDLLPNPPAGRVFISDHTSPWENTAFVEALDGEDRAALVVAGIWLEYEILTTALHALTDGYEVYVALDATPARTRVAARLSLERLLQFGATPVLSSQVIHEWSIEAADTAKRTALSKLLYTLLGP